MLNLVKSFLKVHARVHQLMHLPPCISLRHEEGLLRWGRPTASHCRPIEPVIEGVQVFFLQIELRELRKGCQTHQQGIPEYQMKAFQLPPCGWSCSLFFRLFFLPTIHWGLSSSLHWPFSVLRKGTDDVLRMDEPDLSLAAKLVPAPEQGITSLVSILGFWHPSLRRELLQAEKRSHRTSLKGHGPPWSWPLGTQGGWVCLDQLFGRSTMLPCCLCCIPAISQIFHPHGWGRALTSQSSTASMVCWRGVTPCRIKASFNHRRLLSLVPGLGITPWPWDNPMSTARWSLNSLSETTDATSPQADAASCSEEPCRPCWSSAWSSWWPSPACHTRRFLALMGSTQETRQRIVCSPGFTLGNFRKSIAANNMAVLAMDMGLFHRRVGLDNSAKLDEKAQYLFHN